MSSAQGPLLFCCFGVQSPSHQVFSVPGLSIIYCECSFQPDYLDSCVSFPYLLSTILEIFI